MPFSPEQHLIYRVANSDVQMYPFPHFYVEEVFPAAYYASVLQFFPHVTSMPTLKAVRAVGPDYSEQRLCVPLIPEHVDKLPAEQREFWADTAQWLLGDRFFDILMQKFQPFLAERFKGFADIPFVNEALLVDDHTRYSLGPHTDSPKKVLTLLFYLPQDLSQQHLGTSIYVPRDPNFRCLGGPHYPFEHFEGIFTAPFRPNTLFGFVKTANSFHGVEPLAESEACRRQLLLYDVNVPLQFGLGTRPSAATSGLGQIPGTTLNVKF